MLFVFRSKEQSELHHMSTRPESSFENNKNTETLLGAYYTININRSCAMKYSDYTKLNNSYI